MSNPNKTLNPMNTVEPLAFFQLRGYIKTVTTIPAYVPKTMDQATKIYMNSLTTPTTKRLYIYSFEAGIWNYLTLT